MSDVSKNVAVAGGSAGIGAAGVYEIFHQVDVKSILVANANASPIHMLYALAVFCALALFPVFVYSFGTKALSNVVDLHAAKMQSVAVYTFAAVCAVTVAVFAWESVIPPPPRPPITLKTTFDEFTPVLNYPFSMEPGNRRSGTIAASLSNGAPVRIESTGTASLSLHDDTNLTVQVRDLGQFEQDFEELKTRWSDMTARLHSLYDKCPTGASEKMSQDCHDLLNSLQTIGQGAGGDQ